MTDARNEVLDARARDSGGTECNAELSRQSLRLLESLHYNNFENMLNVMEDFLYGFELCDHDLNFDSIAFVLAAVVAAFELLDKSKDGKVSYHELLDWSHQHSDMRNQLEWLLCHYEALVKASLIPTDRELTQPALKHAERVFSGLGLVQKHLEMDRIHLEDLLMLQHRPGLKADEREAIAELVLFLQRVARRGQDASISAQELADISPEVLWAKRD